MEPPNILYKGSSQKVDLFTPEKVHSTDIPKLRRIGIYSPRVVWATPFKKNALAFAALSRVISFTLSTFENPNGPSSLITFYNQDWETKLDMNAKAYCYIFKPTNFRKVNGREYTSLRPVKPIEVEERTRGDILNMFEIKVSSKFPVA